MSQPRNSQNHFENQLKDIIQSNDWFMSVLRVAQECEIPDWLVGGGVIRNLVWDHLHQYTSPTPLNDVDVAFFDPTDLRLERDLEVTEHLFRLQPEVTWEAKNQAAVHLWYERVFGFPVEPLVSSADAIGTWPEPATCVAVRLLKNDELMIVAPHGLNDLFHMILRRNPRRVTEEIFLKRVRDKQPKTIWPMVRVIT